MGRKARAAREFWLECPFQHFLGVNAFALPLVVIAILLS